MDNVVDGLFSGFHEVKTVLYVMVLASCCIHLGIYSDYIFGKSGVIHDRI